MDDHKSKWIIEGISPQAMEKAILAAAGAGLSLADWLDHLITEVAAKEKEDRRKNQKDKEAD
ncbi:MAG: hypothetical protein HN658_03940 [Rhodospirillales bacterium]|nr:hypothetical protein [Rhodospirillales bacterium]MBT5075365.1 hypothetical protein [Rhodospirillales bacterium]MBT5113906.1 hypothetical protein [Rhodospirillales bacterium]MBT5672434.1 hypothetical protein [Rhodospirillales bacterium]MBT6185897.1 hypothetical protein [Rhodospirillales bacterium]